MKKYIQTVECVLFLLLTIGIIAAMTAITVETAGAMDENAMKVKVMLYSGRPDPVFSLDKNDMEKIGAMLEKARRVKRPVQDTVIPSKLGYKGILIMNSKGKDLPDQIAVYRNRIELRNKRVQFLEDDGSLEKLLLQKAMEKQAIDDKSLEMLRKTR